MSFSLFLTILSETIGKDDRHSKMRNFDGENEFIGEPLVQLKLRVLKNVDFRWKKSIGRFPL